MKIRNKKHIELDILKYELVQEQRVMEKAINLLKKDKHKELIKLHYIEGMTLTQIADLWGDNPSSIRNMKSRILKQLKKYLIENDTK